MSGELRQITFGATTLDIQHWHPGWLAAAEANHADPHDWAFDGLRAAMYRAGQKYISEHPDLFACELT